MNARSLWLTALIAGVGIGFLGNLPVFSLANCLLCIWVWLGGGLAVVLYRRFQPGGPPLRAGQGVGLGALSGLIGAVFGALVFLLTSPLSVALYEGLARSLQAEIDMPWHPGTMWGNLGAAFLFLGIDAVLYPLFGALGALIAVTIMKRRGARAQAS